MASLLRTGYCSSRWLTVYALTFWGPAYVFPLSRPRIGPFHLHVGFAMSLCFSRCCNGKSVAIVFPWFLGCCVCKYLFGLLLSCFGHARAKNNSESPCLLELCSPFRLGLSPCCLHLLHRALSCLFYCGMQWLVFGLLGD